MSFIQANYFPIPQGNPREGRVGMQLTAANGLPIKFSTGSEVFTLPGSMFMGGAVRPSAILSCFIDATGITAGKVVTLRSPSGGGFAVNVTGGNSEFSLCPIPWPADLVVTSGGGTGTVNIILYNFNVNSVGVQFVSPTAGTSGGSGAGSPSGGGSGTPSGGTPSGGTPSGGSVPTRTTF